jgi:hypothetical protein
MVDTNKGIVLAGPGRRAIVCGRLVRRAWTSYRWDDRPRPPTLSPTRTGPNVGRSAVDQPSRADKSLPGRMGI